MSLLLNPLIPPPPSPQYLPLVYRPPLQTYVPTSLSDRCGAGVVLGFILYLVASPSHHSSSSAISHIPTTSLHPQTWLSSACWSTTLNHSTIHDEESNDGTIHIFWNISGKGWLWGRHLALHFRFIIWRPTQSLKHWNTSARSCAGRGFTFIWLSPGMRFLVYYSSRGPQRTLFWLRFHYYHYYCYHYRPISVALTIGINSFS